MYKILLFIFITTLTLNAENMSSFIKEKKEIKELKLELNEFYNKKENEYKKRQSELASLLSKIEKEKANIQAIRDRNKAILNEIEGKVTSKTAKIYNSMKPKIAADIFNRMVLDGKIEEVFDILMSLKEKKVTLIMKFLDLESASIITQMLKNFKVDKKDNNG